MNFKDLLNKGANYCSAVIFLLCLLMSNQISAQTETIQGTVKDAAGLTLPGVNIVEKGTKNSASTDFDGQYKIKITNPKAVLTFSFKIGRAHV